MLQPIPVSTAHRFARSTYPQCQLSLLASLPAGRLFSATPSRSSVRERHAQVRACFTAWLRRIWICNTSTESSLFGPLNARRLDHFAAIDAETNWIQFKQAQLRRGRMSVKPAAGHLQHGMDDCNDVQTFKGLFHFLLEIREIIDRGSVPSKETFAKCFARSFIKLQRSTTEVSNSFGHIWPLLQLLMVKDDTDAGGPVTILLNLLKHGGIAWSSIRTSFHSRTRLVETPSISDDRVRCRMSFTGGEEKLTDSKAGVMSLAGIDVASACRHRLYIV